MFFRKNLCFLLIPIRTRVYDIGLVSREISFNYPKIGVVGLSRRSVGNLRLRFLVAVVAACTASSVAFADIEMSVEKETCTQAFKTLPLDRQSSLSARDIADQIEVDRNSQPCVEFTDILSTTVLGQLANTSDHPSTGTPGPTAKAVRELPAGPGGAMLFLMGVGCLGAVKLGRSARSLHLQSLPEWFHTGGPVQVGHVAVFDFDYYAPVFCTQSEPVSVQQFSHYPRRDLPPRCEDQFLLAVEAPRGPPALF